MSKKALVIVDLQNDYFPGGKFTLVGIEAAAANAARVLAAARAKGETVIHVRHESLSPDAPLFAPGTEGAAINPVVLNSGDEPVVLKNYPNSFRDTNLKDLLDRGGITDVTIVGAMSHMCIDATTRAAADLGYKVTVIQDAVATRDLEFGGVVIPAAKVHAAFMAALGWAYAAIVSTDDYLAASLQSAA